MVFAAKLAEVPNWGKKLVSVNGQEILLVNTKGQIYACETECPHQAAPLSGALLKEAGFLVCQRHGYRFNLSTGECKEFPNFTLKVYQVQVVGDDIMVDI
jgi:nitrite reductase/ring-hydroxylating ferredoxin subunit